MSFGNKLKILRISHRLDQDTISKRLHISQPVYSRYENDEKQVDEHNLMVKKVAEEFGVTPDWLLSSENNILHDAAAAGHHLSKDMNEYIVPPTFLDTLLKQQQMTEQLIKYLSEMKFKMSS